MNDNDNSEEDVDDYMSDGLLAKITEVAPSVYTSRSHQRLLKIEANRDAAKEKAKAPKKEELERNRLEEGLSKPICAESKGFSLLAKMGYKPGMSLGVKREGGSGGITEPIPIQIKSSKTGLGHETEIEEKQKERCMLHLEAMSKQAKAEGIITDDFRTRKRFAVIQKQLISDLQRARKTCEELDTRVGIDSPAQDWFWPIHRQAKKLIEDDEDELASNGAIFGAKRFKLNVLKKFSDSNEDEDETESKESEIKYVYANGKSAPEELLLRSLDELELNNRLDSIVAHIRQSHHFCIWCGCLFTSLEDLDSNCPGPTREDHDGSGEHDED